jgi:succinoglycan biosynthesis protein ExoL
MLQVGGAAVTVAGFRRTPEPVANVAGCPAVDFGRTYNERFTQRIFSVARTVAFSARHRALFANADIILSRNLEMLAIAARGRSLCRPAPALVYECLDIHRLLLRRDFIGSGLRKLEGYLARQASALLTSSPAFVSGYFDTLSSIRLPARLVENKMLETTEAAATGPDAPPRPPGPPWIIGWFGMIRCSKSLDILINLAKQNEGKVEIVIRGRPDLNQFDNFHKTVSEAHGVKFLGPYRNPEDLPAMYHGVHFNWAIDMFEEGLNSSWLLPNRLYEGGAFASVPMTLETVEAGRFVKPLNLGITLKEPLDQSLANFFTDLTPARYCALENTARSIPRSTWISDKRDCETLVAYLHSRVNENGVSFQ